MKFAVFGATGQTGVQLVKQALDAGHSVAALVRNPAKMSEQHDNLTVSEVDIFDNKVSVTCTTKTISRGSA